jgi:hypothetical protein
MHRMLITLLYNFNAKEAKCSGFGGCGTLKNGASEILGSNRHYRTGLIKGTGIKPQ